MQQTCRRKRRGVSNLCDLNEDKTSSSCATAANDQNDGAGGESSGYTGRFTEAFPVLKVRRDHPDRQGRPEDLPVRPDRRDLRGHRDLQGLPDPLDPKDRPVKGARRDHLARPDLQVRTVPPVPWDRRGRQGPRDLPPK